MKTMTFFSRLILPVWLGLILITVSSCSPAAVAETSATTVSSDLALWNRTGGIAGICQQLTIQTDQTFKAVDCKQDQTLAQGQLTATDWSQLTDWKQKYQTFEWKINLPSDSADMFNDSYRFSGAGPQTPSAAEQEEINSYLSDLFARLTEGS